jgi:hypothetical protein
MDVSSSLLEKIEKPSRHATRFQLRGCEICDAVGSKEYSVFIRLYKYYPKECELALSWITDYPLPRRKERLYLWKVHQLRKNRNEK